MGVPALCVNAERLVRHEDERSLETPATVGARLSHEDMDPETGEIEHGAGGEADARGVPQARAAPTADTMDRGKPTMTQHSTRATGLLPFTSLRGRLLKRFRPVRLVLVGELLPVVTFLFAANRPAQFRRHAAPGLRRESGNDDHHSRSTEHDLGPYRWSEMRKLVVLLAIAALVAGSTAVLAGCGPSAPADQPAATPAETPSLLLTVEDGPQAERRLVAEPAVTPSPLLKTTATESTPLVDDSVPTPAPASSAGDGIEFAPVDSFGTSRKEEPIRVVGPDSPWKVVPDAAGPVEGDPYTWQDGDRAMTMKLQTDLVVEKGSGGLPRDVVSASEGGTNVVRSADGQSKSDTLPVFRSESGGLMTLPGGVLLVLSSEWGQAETNAFFSNNGIEMDRLSELDYVANGFFVETGPGFPSLDLANALAVQEGVEISSPNWGREATPK